MDNISLNPGIIKDGKYYYRNLLASIAYIDGGGIILGLAEI